MIRKLQNENKQWSETNFGKHPAWHPLLGIVEELGELCHHYLKRAQGIRKGEDHEAGIRDAVGDIVIYLADFCNVEGIDLELTVDQIWSDVIKRNWNKNPDSAHLEGMSNE